MNRDVRFIFIWVCTVFLGTSCSTVQADLYLWFIDNNTGSQILEKEKSVKSYLETIAGEYGDYEFAVYERIGIKHQAKRTKMLTHSYLIITKISTGELHTLSYYGTEFAPYSAGAWSMDSDSDLVSYMEYAQGKNTWDVRKINIDVDTLKTILKILDKINSGVSYYYLDHMDKKPNFNNCNTALRESVVAKTNG
jgi:hypothetical protein